MSLLQVLSLPTAAGLLLLVQSKVADLTTLKAYQHKSASRQDHEYSLSKLCAVSYLHLHDVDVTFDADEPQLLGGAVPAGTYKAPAALLAPASTQV